MRDSRINTIFEGSSEIMRLFIAREALDPHLKIGAAAVNSSLPLKARGKAAMKAARFYATWYPMKWLPVGAKTKGQSLHPALQGDMDAIAKLSRKLARTLFHAMALNGPKLEKLQVLLGRFVDIGSELFVWSCAVAHAESKILEASLSSAEVERLIKLVTYFGTMTRSRVAELFRGVRSNADKESYAVAKGLLE